MVDANGATSSPTLTITITGTNDAPVNAVPGTQPVNEDTSLLFSAGTIRSASRISTTATR